MLLGRHPSPWLWIPGLGIVGYLAVTRPNIIIWLVLVMAIPRVISLYRRRTDEEKRFYEVTLAQRWTMGVLYFGLVAALVWAMDMSEQHLRQRVEGVRHVDAGEPARPTQAARVR